MHCTHKAEFFSPLYNYTIINIELQNNQQGTTIQWHNRFEYPLLMFHFKLWLHLNTLLLRLLFRLYTVITVIITVWWHGRFECYYLHDANGAVRRRPFDGNHRKDRIKSIGNYYWHKCICYWRPLYIASFI